MLSCFTTTAFNWQRHYVIVLSVHCILLFVRWFIHTDLVTTISYERPEQSLWNLQGIYTSPTDDLIRFWRSKVSVTAGKDEDIHVDTGALKSNFSTYLNVVVVTLLCQECKTSTTWAATALRLPWSSAATNSHQELISQVTGETIARHFSTTCGRSVSRTSLICSWPSWWILTCFVFDCFVL